MGREFGADAGKRSLGVLVLLSVKVSRNPPGLMVACHCKFGKLFLDHEIVELLVAGEFVPEPESVVEEPEPDVHAAAGAVLAEADEQLVVVVANALFLAPDRLPGLVEAVGLDVGDTESAVERIARLGIRFGNAGIVEVKFR